MVQGPHGTGTGVVSYASRRYAEAFLHEGRPIHLPASGAWAIERSIPGAPSRLHDAVAPYPILCCRSWSGLPEDLHELSTTGLVSFTAVLDPLAEVRRSVLEQAFPDLLRPFKTHYVVDLERYGPEVLSKHHRRYVAAARDACEVEFLEPTAAVDDVARLYDELRGRHDVDGRADFPRESIEAQLTAPGVTVLGARVEGSLVAVGVWLRVDDRVYYHIGASTPEGYENRASFALFDRAFRHFAGTARYASLGGGAGRGDPGKQDGLVRFKRGWGAAGRQAWLGGRILDPDVYRTLAGAKEEPTGFFPAYRA